MQRKRNWSIAEQKGTKANADKDGCGKIYRYIEKMIDKVTFKIKLREMDSLWELMGGSCWGLFPPSFYYTHTKEEIEQITKEEFSICILLRTTLSFIRVRHFP